MSKARDVAQLLDKLKDHGCEITVSGKNSHYRITRPGYPGHVTISKTPNNNRGIKNARSDVRRVLGVDI